MSAEAEVQLVLEELSRAISARNVDLVVSHYDDTIVCFNLAAPLATRGPGAIRDATSAWLASWDGPILYALRDLQITACGDVAFARVLHHVDGTRRDGERVSMWWRATYGLRKLGQNWKIQHLHASVPFNMETMQAELALTP